MSDEQKTITVSLKVNKKTWGLFSDKASELGISKSQLFNNMVYMNCWISRQEVTEKAVNCMECCKRLTENFDLELAKEVRKASEDLCQLLLIR